MVQTIVLCYTCMPLGSSVLLGGSGEIGSEAQTAQLFQFSVMFLVPGHESNLLCVCQLITLPHPRMLPPPFSTKI